MRGMFELQAPILEANNICFQYGTRPVLQKCSLELYPGECLAILGRSGSGKSTLLSLLAGRLPLQQASSYHLDGHDLLSDEKMRRLRKLTGYVSQHAATMLDLKLSAAANIARQLFDLGIREAKPALEDCRRWLNRLAMDERHLTQPVEQFSGGMQQRVQIAAALIHRPKVLFLDEPTTGLDAVAQSELIDILRGLKRDRATAMLFVTHDLAIAKLIADRVIVMDDGQVVEEAVCDRILTAPQSPAAIDLVRAVI